MIINFYLSHYTASGDTGGDLHTKQERAPVGERMKSKERTKKKEKDEFLPDGNHRF